MRMVQISRDNYLIAFLKLNDRGKRYIKFETISDKYFTLGSKAFAGVLMEKNSTVQVNGLFSFEKGLGKKLLMSLIDEFKVVKLDCRGEVLRKYYESLGFKVYISMESTENNKERYYELVYCKEENH